MIICKFYFFKKDIPKIESTLQSTGLNSLGKGTLTPRTFSQPAFSAAPNVSPTRGLCGAAKDMHAGNIKSGK
jgi:hypothetical protein